MNKKLLASAVIAAVVASPAAFAESTVYGKMHTSIDAADYDNGRDNVEVNNRSSRLGFKGSEDLGNGLKAIYQIEFGIRSDGGQEQDAGDGHTTLRNTFVGLAGDFGTFVVGRHDTPMKMAFYATGNERLGDSAIDLNPGRNNPIGVFQEFRANNAIAYVSPNFSGFTVAAAMIPGEQSGNQTRVGTGATSLIQDNDLDGVADHYSFGLMYKGNGLKVGAGYELLADQPTATLRTGAARDAADDVKTMQVGASYTMNNFSFGGQYQDSENYLWVEDADYTAWALTGKATFGNNAISLVYTTSELQPDGPNNDVETDGWGVAAEHNFSKRTKVYAAYAMNSVDADDSDDEIDSDTFSLGMIHNF
jgi:predicted porin